MSRSPGGGHSCLCVRGGRSPQHCAGDGRRVPDGALLHKTFPELLAGSGVVTFL